MPAHRLVYGPCQHTGRAAMNEESVRERNAVPVSKQAGQQGSAATPQDWMSVPAPANNAAAFDPSTPHPARVYNYWLGGYFL